MVSFSILSDFLFFIHHHFLLRFTVLLKIIKIIYQKQIIKNKRMCFLLFHNFVFYISLGIVTIYCHSYSLYNKFSSILLAFTYSGKRTLKCNTIRHNHHHHLLRYHISFDFLLESSGNP